MEIYGKSYYIQLNFDKILIHFWNKFLASCYRFIDVFKLLPVRLNRFVQASFERALFFKASLLALVGIRYQ